MTVVVRRGRVIAEPRHRSIRFDRIAPADARSEAAHDLARIALDVVVRAVDPASLPRRWSTPAFGREASVAATYTPPTIDPPEPPGPVRVAYAIRWLELGDDRIRPGWPEWTGQPPFARTDQRKGE